MHLHRFPYVVGLTLVAFPAAAGVLRYAEDQAPGIVNPVFTTSMSEARVNELVFEGLYTDNHELMRIPRLAQSGELSTDRMSMTVHLRSDAAWHDGQKVVPPSVSWMLPV